MEKQKQTKKQQQKKRQKRVRKRIRKTKVYSLPSLHERSETPGALDSHKWESQGVNPLSRTVLLASVCITVTGVLAVGQIVKNRYMYGVSQGKCSEPHSTTNTSP